MACSPGFHETCADTVLSLRSVSYRYAGATDPAIRDVDLTMQDGELLGIVGASEAGKSTLCLVAAGLAPRTIRGSLSGTVHLDGDDAASLKMHELAARIGICFQRPWTQLSGVCETVFEEVAFGPMNLGAPRDETLARTEEALTALAITDLAPRDPARLSGGQMQLVAICGLLAMGPAHLVLDEPTAQLDPAGTRLVADALAQLAASGASILIAEQKTDLLAALCSRIIVLQAGRVIRDGPTVEVLTDPELPRQGVPETSAGRLRRLATEAGIATELLDQALD